mmetsp:Transcript_33517/g.81025  ORF Transcript_33517/g.81025 Transcript_33517/m.81025 type:complete len:238 (-) Transcript_33517:191-904(-)
MMPHLPRRQFPRPFLTVNARHPVVHVKIVEFFRIVMIENRVMRGSVHHIVGHDLRVPLVARGTHDAHVGRVERRQRPRRLRDPSHGGKLGIVVYPDDVRRPVVECGAAQFVEGDAIGTIPPRIFSYRYVAHRYRFVSGVIFIRVSIPPPPRRKAMLFLPSPIRIVVVVPQNQFHPKFGTFLPRDGIVDGREERRFQEIGIALKILMLDAAHYGDEGSIFRSGVRRNNPFLVDVEECA